MKLRKSFWAKILPAACVLLITSCATKTLTVPVPGQGEVKVSNIYAEYYMLGDSYFKLEEYKKASEYYELAMRKKDQYWASYYKLAKCYVYISDWNSALPMYKTILERDPENASLKASIAYIYTMQGDFKKAVKIYEALIQEPPKNQDYLENYLALLLADNKKFEKKNAKKFIETYETLKTEYPENKNLEKFDDEYKKIMKIEDLEDEETEEDSESDEESESEEETSSTSQS